VPQVPQVPLAGIAANTNLEQISDWLTKIIVGVSLTQLFTIKRNAIHLFNAMAPSLGHGETAAAFAGAEVVYFSILGFFMGWLYARLRLGEEMRYADALANLTDKYLEMTDKYLGLVKRAETAGDPGTAQVAKDAAAATAGVVVSGGTAAPPPAGPADMAVRYNQLRATQVSSPARTTQLEDVVRQARWLPRNQKFAAQDVRSMFQTSDDGSRVVALGIMQGDVSSADLESVLDAIRNSRSAFEQYHALVVASLLAPTLNPADQAQFREVLTSRQVVDSIGTDTSRRAVADRLLKMLPDPTLGRDGGDGGGTKQQATESEVTGGSKASTEELHG
jgi:hypothetical protein